MNIERDIIINEYIFEVEYLLSNVLGENTLLNELHIIHEYVKNNYKNGNNKTCEFMDNDIEYIYCIFSVPNYKHYKLDDENKFVNMIDCININKYDLNLFFKYFYIYKNIRKSRTCNQIIKHYIKIMNYEFKKDYEHVICESKKSILTDFFLFGTTEETIKGFIKYLNFSLNKIINEYYNKDYIPSDLDSD